MVQFFFEGVGFTFRERKRLKQFLQELFKKNKIGLGSLTYIFCSDDYLLDINKRFLNHNYYTDIITFYLNGPGQPVEGSIYISIDRVKDNAQLLGVLFQQELHRVIFHGALHLTGYSDKSKAQKKMMRIAEEKCLAAYFDVPRIPVSYRNTTAKKP